MIGRLWTPTRNMFFTISHTYKHVAVGNEWTKAERGRSGEKARRANEETRQPVQRARAANSELTANRQDASLRHRPSRLRQACRKLRSQACLDCQLASPHVPRRGLDQDKKSETVASTCFKAMVAPFRRYIRVAEAWDRICPPIGFSAPPATKVIVAPGSAVHAGSQEPSP